MIGSMVGLEAAAREASAVVKAAGGSPTAASLATDITHELVANALLDAPADGQGNPKYAFRRDQSPVIAVDDACEVAIGVGDGRVFVSVSDRFGRFKPEPVAAAVATFGQRAQVRMGGGGAGLGLRRVLEHSDLFVARVVEGIKTEVICALELEGPRRRADGLKSILFYTVREAFK